MTNSTIGNQVINGLMKKRDRMDKFVRKHLALVLGFMLMLLAGFQPAVLAQNHNNKPGYGVTGSVANHNVQCTKMLSTDGRQVQFTVSGQMPAQAQVNAVPVQRMAPQGKQVFGAYDITINNGNAEWQPQQGQPVMVSISDPNFTDGQMMDVYHEGASGNEFVATVAAQNGTITFPARSFSVYIVTETGDDARLKVNFYQNSQQVADNTPVVIYVKKADDAAGHLNSIIYDPGVGTLDDGVSFRGWIKDKQGYTYEDVENALTIATIRTQVKNVLNDESHPIVDGVTEVNYYAMLFKTYIVSYYDGSPATLGSDNVTFRADATETQFSYIISRTYVPTSSEYNFMGWMVKDETPSTAGNIVSAAPEDGLYQFGDTITIKGNVNFSVDEEQGHWLVFDENGKGATYNAPHFVKNGEITSPDDLLIMERPGYSFGGWYINAECTDGNEFEFGHQLTERTIIYAKWTAHTQADYSVIVWMQKLTDQSVEGQPNADYDFGQTFRIENGAVGQHPDVVNGTIGNTSATVDGTALSFTGFHYAGTDQTTVTITPEGTSVVNVYFDRDVITLNFNTYSGGYYSGSWNIYQSMSGRYGSTLAQNGYTWPTAYDWRSNGGNGGSTSGTRTTFLDAFLPTSNSTTVNFYGSNPSGNYTAYFYKQNSDGNGYTLANQVSISGGNQSTFYLSDKYNGYKCKAWNRSNNTTNWTLVGDTYQSGNETYYDANANQAGNQNITIGYDDLYIYYDVLTYDISFASGSTYTGNNGTNEETGAPTYGNYEETLSPVNLHTEEGVAYGLSIEDYESYVPDASTWPEGYVFDGWYADDQCTTPYTFSTMPANNIMLYAKWRQIRFRVFLHPNAYIEEEDGTLVKDETLDWGSETQAMNFAVAWGNKISVPTGRRSGYEFIGWFTDAGFQHPFDKDALILNNTNVPATPVYDKTQDMTDKMDKWGEITNEVTPYNSDVDRPWVQRKYDLYAQWRATVEGAIGIDVVYDAGDGSNAPTDQNHYLDMSKAIAGAAATAPESKVFSHWVVQKYNCTTGQFEDTPVNVFPGENFTVRRSQSRIKVTQWCDPECESPQMNEEECVYTLPEDQQTYCNQTNVPETYTKIYNAEYTLTVRAEYINVEQPMPTFIIWYNNYEDADPVVLRQDGNTGQEGDTHEKLIVNHAVPIYGLGEGESIPARTGYTFKGWSKFRVSSTSDAPTTHETGENDPNFLIYVPGEDGAAGSYTSVEGDPATEVAADENNPYDYLYAVWEANPYIVRFNKNAEAATGTMADQEFEFDQAQNLTTNAFTYTDHCFQGWATSETSNTVVYTDGESVKNLTSVPNDVVNLYAVWEEKVTPVFDDILQTEFCLNEEGEYSLPASSKEVITEDATIPVVSGTWKDATGAEVNTISTATAGPVTLTFVPVEGACAKSVEVEFTVNQLPTITATATPDRICLGEESTLSATGGTSYMWDAYSPDADGKVTPTVTTTYHVTGTDAKGCVNTAAVTVNVNPTYEVTDAKTICADELPYTWNGVEFTTADTKTATLETVNGCDSVVTMTLTVNPSYEVTDAKTICPNALPYTWNGVEFTSADTKTATLKTVNDCDSVVTMTLTVNPTYEVTDTKTICADELPYTWNGVEFTSADTKTATLKTVNDCDSVVTMTLTVNPTYEVTDTKTICADELPYTWNGVEFTSADTKTATLKTVNDCDSVVTMTLTVNPTYEVTDTKTICADELPYTWNGVEFTSADTKTATLKTVNDCDSVVTMTLTINPTYFVDTTAVECEKFIWYGAEYTTSGDYEKMFTTKAGCDSIVTLHLTINPLPELTITNKEQTITYGDAIQTVVIENENSTLSYTLPPAGFSASTVEGNVEIKSVGLLSAGTYKIPVEVHSDQDPDCGNVKDTIKVIVNPRPLTIKLIASKHFDGTKMVFDQTVFEGTSPAGVTVDVATLETLATGDYLAAGHIETEDSQVGVYTCTDGYFGYMMDMAAIQTGFVVNNADHQNVNANYTPQFQVTLTILEPDAYIECVAQNISLADCQPYATIADVQQPEIIGGTGNVSDYILTPSIAEGAPLAMGENLITWTLYTAEGAQLATCEQTVTVNYPPCDHPVDYQGHTYPVTRIGSQCWLAENLRNTSYDDNLNEGGDIENYRPVNDDESTVNAYGYLYSWYSAVGVEEGNNDAMPTTFTDECNGEYIQGACPEGWAVPSQADVNQLRAAIEDDASMLKDFAPQYWLPGANGVNPNSGFNAHAGGHYNSAAGQFEGRLLYAYFWEADSQPGASQVISVVIAYYCSNPFEIISSKNDLRPVRCVRKQITAPEEQEPFE